MNVWPQNRGKVGKGSEPSMWLASKSMTRSCGSQQPGPISSYVVAIICILVRSNPPSMPSGVADCGMATKLFWT
jgi:hypothetical protein